MAEQNDDIDSRMSCIKPSLSEGSTKESEGNITPPITGLLNFKMPFSYGIACMYLCMYLKAYSLLSNRVNFKT